MPEPIPDLQPIPDLPNSAEEMRRVIAESYNDPHMVGTFLVIAEVIDSDGEPALLSWWDGGTQWSRLGMTNWIGERMRQEIGLGEDDDE